jgi:hypothetical protein
VVAAVGAGLGRRDERKANDPVNPGDPTCKAGQRGSGLLAKLAGRAYHLLALQSGRLRVLSHGVNAVISGPQIAELGLIDERYARIQAEASGSHDLEPRPA